jgi:thioesterase domain-containing protein/acyl carrier protein
MHLDELPLTPNGKVDRRALLSAEQTDLESSEIYLAPRDPIEAALVGIWEEVLGARRIGVRSNFFQLGGDSLGAFRVASLAQQRLAIAVPPTALFEHPTVEALAALVRHHAPSEISPLVSIQVGGSNPPLFFVHPVDGHVFGYFELARRMGEQQPFYGLQAWRAPGVPFATDVEEMARQYVAAIRTVWPSGPYLLGGWSMGGAIAFEMARQLRKAGEEVKLLVLLDTLCPEGNVDLSEASLREEVMQTVTERLSIALGLSLENQADQTSLARLLDQATAAGMLPFPISADQVERFVEMTVMMLKAMRAYRPSHYDGKLTLLNALGADDEHPIDRGWSKIESGGIEIHEVLGHHAQMMTEPMVGTVADLLCRCINGSLSGK